MVAGTYPACTTDRPRDRLHGSGPWPPALAGRGTAQAGRNRRSRFRCARRLAQIKAGRRILNILRGNFALV